MLDPDTQDVVTEMVEILQANDRQEADRKVREDLERQLKQI